MLPHVTIISTPTCRCTGLSRAVRVAVAAAVVLLITTLPVHADPDAPQKRSSSAWTSPIRFFQKYVSKADGDRCPMYPSCSHYASQAIERHGAIKGWVLTCDRLLRCGHDEVRLSKTIGVNGQPRVHDPLKANTRWWSGP